MKKKIHTIDAQGRILGKLAVEIANLLRGKGKEDFVPYKDMGDSVIVKNSDKIKLTGKKLQQKKYYSHSGYLGGLKEKPLSKIELGEALKRAVFGMMPKNKLREEQIKRLKIE